MNLFELFVKIGAKDEASGTISKITKGLGKGLVTAAKIGTAAVGAAAAGITALTTAAVNNYAEYEQLVGGVETLFKDSAGKIQAYADRAYASAGLSANEYMSTVTSFSASLLQSLGGDTEKAADYADMAITDMADNANKMGTDMELIQNAYQGFAKQNYTMLDNLKLGYGGTKEEMQRLVKDASKLDKSIKANDMSFGNIVKSINAVQKEMGIYGTTSKEASATISGSLSAVKAQWNNLLTAISQGDDWDLGVYISNLVDTVSTAFNNLMPVIQKSLVGIAELISQLAPIIVEKLPEVVSDVVPALISGATSMVNSVVAVLPDLLNTVVEALIQNAPALITAAIGLVQSLIQGIQDNYQILVDGAIQIVTQLATGILNMLPQIVQLGLDLIVSLANGIADSLPELIPTIMDVILQIVQTLTDPKNLSNILKAALSIVTQLAWGLVDSIPALIDSVFALIEGITIFLHDPANLAMIVQAAIELVIALSMGIIEAIPKFMTAWVKMIVNVVDYFIHYDWGSLGKNLVDGFKKGVQNAWSNLKKWFKSLFGDLIGIAKKILGIASPSKVFKKIGAWTAEGFGDGFNDAFADVEDDIENALDFGDVNYGIATAGSSIGSFGGADAVGGLSIVQNIYSEAKSAADLMKEALWQQEKAVYLGV